MDPKEAKKRVHKIVLTGVPRGHPIIHMFHGNSISPLTFQDPAAEKQPDNLDYVLSLKIWDGSGGIKFSDLSADEGLGGPRGHDDLCANLKGHSSEAFKFQENLLKTMIQIENTFSELGRTCERDCLIICDRGAMDASAFISPDKWEQLIAANHWNNVELRDNRYNHIVHMVSAANGAVEFYSTEDHACRSEGVELAQELDSKAAAAWIGHPYFDVIDNTTDFESKMKRMIASVCQKIGLDTGDRLSCNSKKLKFLIKGPLPPDSEFPKFQDFDVVHNYLQNNGSKMQARLRKRGQKGHWSYTYTIRRPHRCGQSVEVKTQLTHKDYTNRLEQKDKSHFTIRKKRRCFIINNQYYQLDIYKEPGHQRCEGLILLETYSAHEKNQLLGLLPQFLTIEKEVTGNPDYSMFNLSLLEEWKTSKQFCRGAMTNGTDEKEETSSPADSRTSVKMTLKITNGATEIPEQTSKPKLINGTSHISNGTSNGTSNGVSNGASNGTKNIPSSRITNEAPKNEISKRHKANGIHKPETKRSINGKV